MRCKSITLYHNCVNFFMYVTVRNRCHIAQKKAGQIDLNGPNKICVLDYDLLIILSVIATTTKSTGGPHAFRKHSPSLHTLTPLLLARKVADIIRKC